MLPYSVDAADIPVVEPDIHAAAKKDFDEEKRGKFLAQLTAYNTVYSSLSNQTLGFYEKHVDLDRIRSQAGAAYLERLSVGFACQMLSIVGFHFREMEKKFDMGLPTDRHTWLPTFIDTDEKAKESETIVACLSQSRWDEYVSEIDTVVNSQAGNSELGEWINTRAKAEAKKVDRTQNRELLLTSSIKKCLETVGLATLYIVGQQIKKVVMAQPDN